jgi:hypothetical protein
MLPITLQDTSFKFGIWDIPYDVVLGAGIAVQKRNVGEFRTLLIACGPVPGAAQPNPPLITFRLERDGSHAEFVEKFRARIGGRWHGEDAYFAMRKKLGFSNRGVFLFVGGIVVLTIVGVVLALVLSSKPSNRPLPRGNTPTAPARR